jgi:hypothetical protein
MQGNIQHQHSMLNIHLIIQTKIKIAWLLIIPFVKAFYNDDTLFDF